MAFIHERDTDKLTYCDIAVSFAFQAHVTLRIVILPKYTHHIAYVTRISRLNEFGARIYGAGI